jgi:SET domain-containing protein
MIANRDILPGEEISISYGETNEWLENRGIIIKEVTNTTSSVRSMEDLKENGHCITQVKVILNSVVFNL